MQIQLNVDFKELENAVKQLTINELKRLNSTINHVIVLKKHPRKTNIQKLILKSPTWTDSQYNDYLSAREQFNKSRLI